MRHDIARTSIDSENYHTVHLLSSHIEFWTNTKLSISTLATKKKSTKNTSRKYICALRLRTHPSFTYHHFTLSNTHFLLLYLSLTVFDFGYCSLDKAKRGGFTSCGGIVYAQELQHGQSTSAGAAQSVTSTPSTPGGLVLFRRAQTSAGMTPVSSLSLRKAILKLVSVPISVGIVSLRKLWSIWKNVKNSNSPILVDMVPVISLSFKSNCCNAPRP